MRQKRYFQTASYGRESRQKGSLLLGILLGIFFGVTAVIGVAIYLNYAASPITHSNQSPHRLEEQKQDGLDKAASLTSISGSQSASASKPPAMRVLENTGQVTAANTKDFDFYKILPGKSEAVLKSKEPTKKAEPSSLRCYLQLGSFQDAKDANNLKAKLALIGIHASIQSVQIEGHGLLHRLRIGPIPQASVDPIKVLLQQNGIQATLVRSP